MTFIRNDLCVRVPWQPPGLWMHSPISQAHSTTPAGFGGCFHFPGPAGLQSSITTQLLGQQRLWNFGGGQGVWPFDACFLFSMNICCFLKRWIRCSHKETRAALSSPPPGRAASSSHRKGSFAKCDHNLRTPFWCQHREKIIAFATWQSAQRPTL